MDKYWNPFEVYRAEMASEPINDYFVAPEFLPTFESSKKPMVLIGGRGTGKTTLLKYLSFDSQSEILKTNFNDKCNYIGIYWKVDTNYVTAFEGSQLGAEEWNKIFAHYVNLQLSVKLCEITVKVKQSNDFVNEELISRNVGKVFLMKT